MGLKNHKRADAKEQVRKVEEAGMRSVVFSKEGLPETLSLGKDLGMETDWNSCISLKTKEDAVYEKKHDFQGEKPDGWNVLPIGTDEIKWHIKHIDDVPLRVPLFCDVDEKTTEEMY